MSSAALAAPQAARRRSDWIWLIGLWLTLSAYNLFKPFHIDDVAHLEIAQWIASHPLHPMSGPIDIGGFEQPIHETNQPHLYFYLLAIWGRLFGFTELPLHALQSVFALACIGLFHRLAVTLIPTVALWATSLLALSPALIVEQNLMVDAPLLALWLAVFSLLIRDGGSSHQTRRYVLAGLSCAAAVLVKYSSLVLLPVLLLSLLMERRHRQLWTLLIPIGAIVAWSAFNDFDYGGIHIAERPINDPHSPLRPAALLLAWLLALGAVTPLGLLAVEWPRRRLIPALVFLGAAFTALVAAVATGLISDQVSDIVLWVAFAANGALMVAGLAMAWRDLPRRALSGIGEAGALAPRVYLAAWILGTTAFYIVFAPFIAVRHVLLILPPVILVLAMGKGEALSRSVKIFSVASTALVSAGLCLSDWRFADFYRTEPARLAHVGQDGHRWVDGGFGLLWYAKQNGYRTMDPNRPLAPGDVLLVGPYIAFQTPALETPVKRLRLDVQTKPLLNLFCTGRPWRFYEFTYAEGPWSLSRNCLGRVDLWIADPAH